MRVLLVDNSKPECAIFTPKLEECLQLRATHVHSVKTLAEAACALDMDWDAVVLSGSSLNMSQSVRAAAFSKDLMTLLRCPDVPCLGVCFGMQLMAVAYGGKVERLSTARNAVCEVRVSETDGSILPRGTWHAFFCHQDVVVSAPPRFAVDAYTDNRMIASISAPHLRRYGVQFHPECSDAHVQELLSTFLHRAALSRIRVHDQLHLTPLKFMRVAWSLGRAPLTKVADEERLSVEDVLVVWKAFRDRYRIPAVLL